MLVKIKSWDKMAKKYELDEDGVIKYIKNNGKRYVFTEKMKYLCGKEIELNKADGSFGKNVIGEYDGFYIEKWMVKKNGK